jgi:PAS domain S-box-containing protein
MTMHARPTIVVVNDDPVQLHLTSSILEQDGMRVIRCRGAEEALAILQQQPAVDAIVTDLHMPHIDGWRFCRLLRSPEYAAYNRIPILVVSATFFGADAEQITADLGANAFLAVPHDPSTLRTCLHRLLRGEVPPAMLHVLLVEDRKPEALMLRRALEARGWVVFPASTVERGRRLFRDITPEIVILDYHLPDGTARDLLTEVKPAGGAAVAIVITAEPDPSHALDCMRLGADGYVPKPFDPEYLIALCERARRERSFLRVEELLNDRTRDLRESETRFRSLLESLPETIIVRDEAGVILHISESGAERLGWRARDLIGLPCESIMVAGGRHETAWSETELITRRGRRIAVEVIARPIVFNGGPALLQVARDITERKRTEAERAKLEEQLRQAQKMEAIGTLAGGVAHDFNNVLTAILGHVHLLKQEAPPDDPIHQRMFVIEAGVQRARHLTDQLLVFARGGKQQNVIFDLHATIREVFQLLDRTMGQHIACQVELHAERCLINGDPGQLHQVMLNLALNARDAMPRGGTLRCRTDLLPGTNFIRLSLSDSGSGIPEEIRGRIFEPFFTTKPAGQGTGMGLAMVYAIIQNHAGSIEVESEVGQGTTFHLSLPLACGPRVPARTGANPLAVTSTRSGRASSPSIAK